MTETQIGLAFIGFFAVVIAGLVTWCAYPFVNPIRVFIGTFLMIIFGAIALGTGTAWGQDGMSPSRSQGYFGQGHDQFHDKYLLLPRNRHMGSCCNGKDCRPTTARWIGDRWQAKVDGVWTDIPNSTWLDEAYLEERGMSRWDTQAHVCAGQVSKRVYCFLEPLSGQ